MGFSWTSTVWSGSGARWFRGRRDPRQAAHRRDGDRLRHQQPGETAFRLRRSPARRRDRDHGGANRHRRRHDRAVGRGAGRARRNRLRDRGGGVQGNGRGSGVGTARRRGGAVRRRCGRLRPPRVRLRRAAHRDPGPAGRAALFGTSRDPTLPMPGGAWPGTGATLAAVETASGKRAETGGKPEPHLFDQAPSPDSRGETRRDRGRPHRIGHRRGPASRADHRAVLTGACTRADAEAADPRPDHVLDDLAGLLA